jgi:heptosyltransferase III
MQYKNILIIMQRSNGDVLLSNSLIYEIKKNLNPKSIDLLVNDDTLLIAKSLPHVNDIHTFSYDRKKTSRWSQEKLIFSSIFRKYDLSINLTASDRSVIYGLIASRNSISAIEENKAKSWWKKIFLKSSYYFSNDRHILINNLEPLSFLNIEPELTFKPPKINQKAKKIISKKLDELKIKNFIIFHPSAQYNYKIYPKKMRDELLKLINTLSIKVIITGSNNEIDTQIKKEIPQFDNIFNWIGNTTIDEYIALSDLSDGYLGMDTLNMHIAASQNKKIFAIFGPTKLKMWSPWSNQIQRATSVNIPLQIYGNITIFQSSFPCDSCGLIGCGSSHGKNNFIFKIKPKDIFHELEKWYKNVQL